MTAETVARIIQLIIAPAVMITVCSVIQNGILGRYGSIGDRLRALAIERLKLLDAEHSTFIETERIREIDFELPIVNRRHRLLQDALLVIYGSDLVFLLVMFTIALSIGFNSGWIATGALILFLFGTVVLLIGILFITIEIRMSHQAIYYEIKRVSSLSRPFPQTKCD